MTPGEFRALRACLGLTQAALARMLYCHVHHISNIEQGRRVPSDTLCELLKMKVVFHNPEISYIDKPTGQLHIVDD